MDWLDLVFIVVGGLVLGAIIVAIFIPSKNIFSDPGS